MHDKSINLQRTESLLKELISEALSSLNDNRINALSITQVNCKNGKYDALVYYEGTNFNNEEQKIIQKLLKKANGHIKSYCLASTSWYKCPDFKFICDTSLDQSKKIEDLFGQIKK